MINNKFKWSIIKVINLYLKLKCKIFIYSIQLIIHILNIYFIKIMLIKNIYHRKNKFKLIVMIILIKKISNLLITIIKDVILKIYNEFKLLY